MFEHIQKWSFGLVESTSNVVKIASKNYLELNWQAIFNTCAINALGAARRSQTLPDASRYFIPLAQKHLFSPPFRHPKNTVAFLYSQSTQIFSIRPSLSTFSGPSWYCSTQPFTISFYINVFQPLAVFFSNIRCNRHKMWFISYNLNLSQSLSAPGGLSSMVSFFGHNLWLSCDVHYS